MLIATFQYIISMIIYPGTLSRNMICDDADVLLSSICAVAWETGYKYHRSSRFGKMCCSKRALECVDQELFIQFKGALV